MVGSGKMFISLLLAANGVGKTRGGSEILAHLFWPCGNKYFQGPLFKDWPYPKVGRIISDPTTLEQTIIPELKSQFPSGRYVTNKGGARYEKNWDTDTGWHFDLMSYEQDVKEFESSTLGWAWFDEPPPMAIFKATVARMRKGGVIFITMTPLMGSAWVYDHIIANPDRELLKDTGQRDWVQATVESACKTHGIRGFLEHSDILRMVSEYSEEDKHARIFGKFHHLTGLIYKMFDRKIHVIPPREITRKDYVVTEWLDPHPRTQDALLWLAMDKQGTKFVVDEYFDNPPSLDELAQIIKAKSEKYRLIKRSADPSAFIEDQHTKQTLARLFADRHGLYYTSATKDRAFANRRIGEALSYQLHQGVFMKAPELYIFNTCKRLIWELEHYVWDEWRGKAGERKDPREKPVDKDDHMIENLGRALVDDTQFEHFIDRTNDGPLTIEGETGDPLGLDPY